MYWTANTVWHVVYLLLLLQLGVKILAVADGRNAWLKGSDLGANAFGVGVFGWVAFAGEYLVPANGAANLEKLAAVNQVMSVGFRIGLVCAVVGVVTSGWKLVKKRAPAVRMAF